MGSVLTGREYLRVSQDHSGRARSIEEQHTDNIRAGQEHGFSLNGEPYSDVSLSAAPTTAEDPLEAAQRAVAAKLRLVPPGS